MEAVHFILFVADQQKSTAFYSKLLGIKPSLNVKGMTEFSLFNKVKIGLMPNNGIAKIISKDLPHPKTGIEIPRCEIYLKVTNLKEYINRAKILNAKIVSNYKARDWGDSVMYIADLDNHIIALAEKTKDHERHYR